MIMITLRSARSESEGGAEYVEDIDGGYEPYSTTQRNRLPMKSSMTLHWKNSLQSLSLIHSMDELACVPECVGK